MTGRREFLKGMAAGAFGLFTAGEAAGKKRAKRPNILWIVAEDMNPWLSCYGQSLIETPVLDAMADAG